MATPRPPRSGSSKTAKKPMDKVTQPANSSRKQFQETGKDSPASAVVEPVVIRSGTPAAVRRPQQHSSRPPQKKKPPVLLYAAIGAVVVAAAAIFFILTSGTGKVSTASVVTPNPAATVGTSKSSIAIAPDPSAKAETFPNQGQQHINVGDKHEPYNSDPPTSGPHYVQPYRWGVFNQPLVDEGMVHNLEHGGIVIQYYCPEECTTAVNQLAVYAQKYPPDVFSGVLLAPRANPLPNGAKIVLTAWTHRLLLNSLDSQKVNEFITTFFNKAPESAG